ncbi:MAG: DUF1266 domain-containing protein [candidate division WOR-3 bacterium]|nr:MAG: DUF1266 domain-containing protein [candidate division WOR-3 bacterium]
MARGFARRWYVVHSILRFLDSPWVIKPNVLILSCILSLYISCGQRPKIEQRLWALATTSVLTEYNRERHDILEGVARTEENIAKHHDLLNYWWGIDSRDGLFFVLDWLEQVGHRKRFDEMGQYMNTLTDEEYEEMIASLPVEDRSSWEVVRENWTRLGAKSLIGWDFCRYIHLCRRGHLLGYLSESESWKLIMPKARFLQVSFDSWADLGDNYLVGREFWSLERTEASGEFFCQAYRRLIENPESPWNTIPWELALQ